MMQTDNRVIRADSWLQKQLSWSSGQIDIIKVVALLLMLLDHANRVLHFDITGLMLVGRGAFPLFGLVWAYNLCRHPTLRQSSLNTLWVWALLSQLSYVLAGEPWWQGNILFAFAVTGQALSLFERGTRKSLTLAVLLVVAWLPFSATSYGIAGVFMLINSHRLFRATTPSERLGYAMLWAFMVLLLNADVSPIAAVAGLVVPGVTLSLVSQYPVRFGRFLPAHFFVLFYALHLAVLGILASEL